MKYLFLLLILVSMPFVVCSQELFVGDNFQPDMKIAERDRQQPWVVRSRYAIVDFDLLNSRSENIVLNLFEDIRLNISISKVENLGKDSYVCYAKAQGIEDSDIVISVKDNGITASIRIDEDVYAVSNVDENLYGIYQHDHSRFPEQGQPIPVYNLPTLHNHDANPSAVSTIDVLVVYTDDARVADGGTAAIESRINLAISETNTGYSNSGVNQIVRLVHMEEVQYDETNFNWSNTLSALKNTNDGILDNVHTLRDTYGADEVVLIVNDGVYCGLAYRMITLSTSFASSAFSLVSRTCATGYYSFAHEMGHNMGSHHDRATVGTPLPSMLQPYSFGFQDTLETFRTIMAYNCTGGCTRVNYWSNPNNTMNGRAMGVADPAADSAENFKSLNYSGPTVAAFRPTAVKSNSDFDGNGKSDILWRNSSSGLNYMWFMNGAALGSSNSVPTVSDTNLKVVKDGDFDADGKSDILWRHATSGLNYIWLMNGAAIGSSNSIPTVSDTSLEMVGVGDFDGDGKSDILWRHANSGLNYIWLMNGTALGSSNSIPTITDVNLKIAGVGDFDGDGKSDILWRHATSGLNYIWLMNGATLGSSNSIPTITDTNLKIVGVGDFDGDGKSDILWRHATSGLNYIWLMNGATLGSSNSIPTITDTNLKIVGVGDFDGDGKSDILWRHATSGLNYIWLMNGAAIGSSNSIPTVTDLNLKIVAYNPNVARKAIDTNSKDSSNSMKIGPSGPPMEIGQPGPAMEMQDSNIPMEMQDSNIPMEMEYK